jgi:GT2 family glycosyltransferase
MDAAVVIASYRRTEFLERCLAALAAQRVAVEAVVVGRRGDDETKHVAESHPIARYVEVAATGHLPPLKAGVAAARTGIVCFVDDDAEPWPQWTSTLLRHYHDPTVGGVGGLVVQPGPDERAVSSRIGLVSSTGRFDATHLERIPTDWTVREVDVLRGTNMSFRRELLTAYPWDGRLNVGAATDYELDLCAWVRRQGFRIVYDPDAIVTHHLAPRPDIGRAQSRATVAAYSHNLVYVAGKALPPVRGAAAIGQALLIGNRASYAPATFVADLALGHRPSVRNQLVPALVGKLRGLRSLAAYWRRGGAEIEE